MSKTCRILIADDHPIFRDGLRRLVQSEPDFDVVGEAVDGESVVIAARDLKPDIILLDLAMPRNGGMHALKELAASARRCRVIILTASITKRQMTEALQLGAHGIVLKESATHLLFIGIRQVMEGKFWLARESVTDLVEALRDVSTASKAEPEQKSFGLTPREREIVTLIVTGYSNPDIAQRCAISEQTVKHHVSNIFDKLGVYNRVELALFAVNHNLTGEAP
jgi:two-component system nitrate/nitrite response regulator NarL